MLIEESIWLKKVLSTFNFKSSTLLNFGSSTGHFRKFGQPLIYENNFKTTCVLIQVSK